MNKKIVEIYAKMSFLKVRIISYYNLVVPSIMIIGSFTLYFFSKKTGVHNEELFKLPFLAFVLICIFYICSAILYLNHIKIGRFGLLLSCILQILHSIRDIYITFKVNSSLDFIYIIMFFFGLWAIWYLNTDEAKEWLNNR